MVTFFAPNTHCLMQGFIVFGIDSLDSRFPCWHDRCEKAESDLAVLSNFKKTLALNFLFVFLLSNASHQFLEAHVSCFNIQHAVGTHGCEIFIIKSDQVCKELPDIKLWPHLTKICHWKQLNVYIQ